MAAISRCKAVLVAPVPLSEFNKILALEKKKSEATMTCMVPSEWLIKMVSGVKMLKTDSGKKKRDKPVKVEVKTAKMIIRLFSAITSFGRFCPIRLLVIEFAATVNPQMGVIANI